MDVLTRTMIRASKADVQGRLLQACHKSVVRLPFDADHQACYNVLIEARPSRHPRSHAAPCVATPFAAVCCMVGRR